MGAVGWFVYELAVLYGADAAAASLIAVIPLSLAARICAVLLKPPVPVFLLPGIFPLVPGAGIYYPAYYFIQGENALSLANGSSTFKVAVARAVGIARVLGLPYPGGRPMDQLAQQSAGGVYDLPSAHVAGAEKDKR